MENLSREVLWLSDKEFVPITDFILSLLAYFVVCAHCCFCLVVDLFDPRYILFRDVPFDLVTFLSAFILRDPPNT
jgi:hypothetical protein